MIGLASLSNRTVFVPEVPISIPSKYSIVTPPFLSHASQLDNSLYHVFLIVDGGLVCLLNVFKIDSWVATMPISMPFATAEIAFAYRFL